MTPEMTQVELESKIEVSPVPPLRDLTYDEYGLVWGDSVVSSSGLNHLELLVGVPTNFLQKCSHRLSRDIIREFLSRSDKNLMSLMDTGTNEFEGFRPETFVFIPTQSVVDVVSKALPNETISVVKESTGIGHFSVFLSTDRAFDAPDGKEIFFGVRYQSSLTGRSSTKLQFSFFRPWCSNGAYVKEVEWTLSRRSLESTQVALIQIAEQVPLLYGLRDEFETKIVHMADTPVEDPLKFLDALMRRHGISRRYYDSIVSAMVEEETATEWGVMNAITRAANFLDRPSHADELMQVGGAIMIDHAQFCPTCGV